MTPDEEELERAKTGIFRSRDGNFVWDMSKHRMTFTVTWDDETPENKKPAAPDDATG